jgi:hypothetical protein
MHSEVVEDSEAADSEAAVARPQARTAAPEAPAPRRRRP